MTVGTRYRRSRILRCFVLIVPTLLRAQSRDSTSLPRVVITATRIDAPLGRALSTITVLDGSALRREGVRDVADALRRVPGVAVARAGSAGAQTSLFLRGGESDYVRVLVDGVPVNEAGGSIDLSWLSLDNVERIEVVRGPASVLYGTDAVTGVIQIFTRSAPAHSTVEAGVSAGRYAARSEDVTLGMAGRVAGAVVAASHAATDGILPFNNAYRNGSLSARVMLTPRPERRAALTARLNDDVFHYPTDGAGNVVDRNAYRADRHGVVSFDAEQQIAARLRAAVTLASFDGHGRTEDAQDDAADTEGLYLYRSAASLRRRVADARLQWMVAPSAVLAVGGEWTGESQRSSDTSNYAAARSHFSQTRSNRAAYAELLAERGRMEASLGGRYDDNGTFGVFRTARASLANHPWRGGTVRASASNAFKAPTFFETFSTVFSTGNPALRPERARTWELAVRQEVADQHVSFSAVWFDQDFRDLIQYSFVAPDLPNYFNIAAASARGLELEVIGRSEAGVRLDGSVTMLRTRVENAGVDNGPGATFVQGGRLLRRPPLSATLGTSITRWRRANGQAQLTYVSRRDDRDFSTFPARPVQLQAYTRLDVGTTVQLRDEPRGPSVALQLRLENVLGTGYQEVYGFPVPGRALSAGVRVGAPR